MDKIQAHDSFVIYGWKDDFTDRIVTNLSQKFSISYFTEKPYCRGSVLYGIKCIYNAKLESYFISEIDKNKVLNAYVHYTLVYRDEDCHNFQGLHYLDAVHSDNLESIYKYADEST